MNTMIENSSVGSATVECAGLGKRLKAFLFDYLVICFYIFVWVGIGVSVTVAAGPLDQISPLFAHTSIYYIEGLPFAPIDPSPMVMAGLVLVYVLVGVYIASALISKKHRTPYDWAAGSFVIETN